MSKADEMRRYRAKDTRVLVQIRLAPETVERLDAMVRDRGASGRAEVVDWLVNGQAPAAPAPEGRRDGKPTLSRDGLFWL
jgi:hypothetical protein